MAIKEFLSVKEFSKISGIEQTTLRYWDDIGLFSPIRRDPENNYRYYSLQQIIAVNFITVLSSLNIPLKMISEMDDNRSPEKIVRMIRHQEKQLDMDMRRLRECYSIIHTRLELINFGMRADTNRIFILRQEKMPYILGPRNIWKPGEGFYEPFMNFCHQAEEMRINLSFPIGAMHDGWDGFMEAPGEPNYFISIDPIGNRRREAGDYLVGFVHGYYGQFSDLPERMDAYAKENGLKLYGPVYTIYLQDEICIKDPDQYLAQICVAVSK